MRQEYLDETHNSKGLAVPKNTDCIVFGEAAFAPITFILFWSMPLKSKSGDLAGEEVQTIRNQSKKVLTKGTLLSVRTGHNTP